MKWTAVDVAFVLLRTQIFLGLGDALFVSDADAASLEDVVDSGRSFLEVGEPVVLLGDVLGGELMMSGPRLVDEIESGSRRSRS